MEKPFDEPWRFPPQPEGFMVNAAGQNVEFVGITPGACYAVAVEGDIAYIVAGVYLLILDITDKSVPALLGSVQLPGMVYYGIAVSGGYAYIADGNTGLRVVDVSNPSIPIEKGYYDTPGYAYGVAIANNLIYVADDDGGMSILRFTAAELRISSVSPSNGPAKGGTEIKIYGTNFKAGATVTIGGKAAINPVVDPVAQVFITATTPSGKPGSADVVVTNPDGESATLEDGFKYIAPTEVLPARTALLPNYPNPFNLETWIPYQLSAESDVTVELYNIHGRLMRVFALGIKPAGSYVTKDRAVYWDGKNEAGERVASGVYFYRLKAVSPSPGLSPQGRGDYGEAFSAVRRLVVVK
ncbi:hypothetical protein FJZ31_10930 [Candidatus Poribacteria bacterium]|nr:hypothetical protein [Candidatus Poribacteria bacterium]